MSESNRELSDKFFADFTAQTSDIVSRLNDAKPGDVIPSSGSDAIATVVADLAALRKALADAITAGYIPTYDQRRLNDELKVLETKLQSAQNASASAKPRFTFKRNAKAAQTSSISGSSASTSVTTAATVEARLTEPAAVSATASASVALSGRTGAYITHESLPEAVNGVMDTSNVTLQGLDHCIVDLRSSFDNNLRRPITAVHAQDVKNSVLLLPKLSGSIIMYDIQNCVIVVECQQFRMHSSTHVDVLLSVTSSPVIEHCSDIRFGDLHGSGHIAGESEGKLPFEPQDFSHIRPTPSPHWSQLPQHVREARDVSRLQALFSGGNGSTLGEVVAALKGPGVLPMAPSTTE